MSEAPRRCNLLLEIGYSPSGATPVVTAGRCQPHAGIQPARWYSACPNDSQRFTTVALAGQPNHSREITEYNFTPRQSRHELPSCTSCPFCSAFQVARFSSGVKPLGVVPLCQVLFPEMDDPRDGFWEIHSCDSRPRRTGHAQWPRAGDGGRKEVSRGWHR
ncbi:hypothetical protein RRG08_033712 [Elysia crispata]|uniref:Uncharacterized protein n=1 Tax=Elysia crispata TaxID=231223 RepID=A0AAE1A8W4_9GAST|nr:hypothetical protein RRG08_033712 [Elysia crispata]